jgi:hypothetical protein
MKGFRFNLLQLLGKFDGVDGEKKIVNEDLKQDLWIWKKTIGTSLTGFPLGEIFGEIPLVAKQFISDAAGAAFEWTNGKSKNITVNGDRGVASIEYEEGKPIGAIILRWPDGLLTKLIKFLKNTCKLLYFPVQPSPTCPTYKFIYSF